MCAQARRHERLERHAGVQLANHVASHHRKRLGATNVAVTRRTHEKGAVQTGDGANALALLDPGGCGSEDATLRRCERNPCALVVRRRAGDDYQWALGAEVAEAVCDSGAAGVREGGKERERESDLEGERERREKIRATRALCAPSGWLVVTSSIAPSVAPSWSSEGWFSRRGWP